MEGLESQAEYIGRCVVIHREHSMFPSWGRTWWKHAWGSLAKKQEAELPRISGIKIKEADLDVSQ